MRADLAHARRNARRDLVDDKVKQAGPGCEIHLEVGHMRLRRHS
jgi:hypothetical protein